MNPHDRHMHVAIDEARKDKLKTLVFKINQLSMDLALERA